MKLFNFTMVILLCLACSFNAFAQENTRTSVNMSGVWEYVKVQNLDTPLPTAGWQSFNVPGTIYGADYERAWFRRDFTVPVELQRQRIELHLGGVKYNSRVIVNGQNMGGCYNGYDAFDVDITAAVRFGEVNRLELGCHDWTGIFSTNDVDFKAIAGKVVEMRDVPKDRVLGPIGGLVNNYGPWDDIYLRSHPTVYVKDIFIKPSVRKNELVVDYTLCNQTGNTVQCNLQAFVDDKGQTALELPVTAVNIPAQDEIRVTVTAPWGKAHLWSHEDPYLYYLQTTLQTGSKILDTQRERFGFREFWREGSKFFLNGQRINLRATSWWPELSVSKEYVQERIADIQAANCIIFRTHTQPWSEVWYETADEMGLLITPEGAVWNDDYTYRLGDARFWDNYATHLKSMVDRMKNHPAVVMYSLENEMFGGRFAEIPGAVGQLARMGELVRQWDPTRLIYYESDGDPENVADVIGIHYPHEYPQYTTWPNTAYWMDTPHDMSGWGWFEDGKKWVWDRKKPGYVGEYLWLPSSDPSWHTVFYGDEAYLDYHTYRDKGKGDSWIMATQAYRYYEIGGFSPWTMVEGGKLDETNPMYTAQRYAMAPVAAYLREYAHNFYGANSITRTFDVYNDTLTSGLLTINWELHDGDKILAQGSSDFQMIAGERKELSVNIPLPRVPVRRDVQFIVHVLKDGVEKFTDTKDWSIFPSAQEILARTAQGLQIGLYDPTGETRDKLAAVGIETVPVIKLDDIPAKLSMLIIGAQALQTDNSETLVIGRSSEQTINLNSYVAGGGRVLVLEQDSYPAAVLPATLDKSHQSTMCFAQLPDHPLLVDVKSTDLKWWQPDNFITTAEPFRPSRGGGQAVVVSGSQAGINHAPLLEVAAGKGLWVLSQMKLAAGLMQEPTAALILRNTLNQLTTYQPVQQPTALICSNPAVKSVLDEIGLVYEDITVAPEAVDWSRFGRIFICTPLNSLIACDDKLEKFINSGGTLYLHDVKPGELEQISSLAALGFTMVPFTGTVMKVPQAHELSKNITNEDLYWLAPQPSAWSWNDAARDGDMAGAVFGVTLDGREVKEYPQSSIRLEGEYTMHEPDYALLTNSNSKATVTVDIPVDGMWIIGVMAGGTPAQDILPEGAISVDGLSFGAFHCQSTEMQTYTTFGELKAGPHEVLVRFTNDANSATEDRNLFVSKLMLARGDDTRQAAFLTTPAAVGVIKAGSGQIVVDNIKWDSTKLNTGKGLRYINNLLTGLGAEFNNIPALSMSASKMESQPDVPWFRQDDTGAYMGSSGWIKGQFICEQAGAWKLNILARGTTLKGIGCLVKVEIDGVEVGEIEATSPLTRIYPVPVTLSAGEHELRLIFTNDEWAPPEDRNFFVERIEFHNIQLQ